MQKAFEFLGPIGTALAAVVSFLMLWTGIRAAIGRQIRSETGETLARIEENIKTLVIQTNTLHEDNRALREDNRALREELSTLRGVVISLGENYKTLRDDLRQVGDKVDNTASVVNWLRGVLHGYVRAPEKPDVPPKLDS